MTEKEHPPLKIVPFEKAEAHPGDLLTFHLEQTAAQAARSVSAAGQDVRLIAGLSALFHDLGKSTAYFQRLLKAKVRTSLSSHSPPGAVLSWFLTERLGVELKVRLAVFSAIRLHHSGLRGLDGWDRPYRNEWLEIQDDRSELRQQLSAIDLPGMGEWLPGALDRAGFRELLRPMSSVQIDLEAVIQSLQNPKGIALSKLGEALASHKDAIGFLAAFGSLLTADRIHTATGGTFQRQSLPGNAVFIYKKKFAGMEGQINSRRKVIADEVMRTWQDNIDRGLFTLTAPTGTGKTLAILDAALRVREIIEDRGQIPRIIYCLPFTSIIDQNHRVFQEVFAAIGLARREDILLKHHHLTEGLYRTAAAEYLPDGAGQLLTETWQSEVVVTTFHQLLYSLFSGKNANLVRAGQLPGSIVLMDEVQAIPLKYWSAIRQVFGAAVTGLGCRFVLLTATRPLIFSPDDPEVCELLPSHREHFLLLSRTVLTCRHHRPVTLEQFIGEVSSMLQRDSRPTLIILNRRRTVGEVFSALRERFPERRLIALSTNLTPRDRRARIRLARTLVRKGIPLIVVSTQLIEAGVDLSFPVVHRDMAPLDSIIQTCGRCNRHQEEEMGEVFLWEIVSRDGDQRSATPLWRLVYDAPLIEVTKDVLRDVPHYEEKDFLELSRDYFEGCRARMEQSPLEEYLRGGRFGELELEFKLIEEGPPTVSCFVIRSRSDRELWERYDRLVNDRSLSDAVRKARFREFRHAFFEHVIQVYSPPSPVGNPVIPIESGPGSYTREIGFVSISREASTCTF